MDLEYIYNIYFFSFVVLLPYICLLKLKLLKLKIKETEEFIDSIIRKLKLLEITKQVMVKREIRTEYIFFCLWQKINLYQVKSNIKMRSTILGIIFWQKYTKFPFPNINVVCDILQMLCGHKNLSNIEVRGRGTGKLDFFLLLPQFMARIVWKWGKKRKELVHK